MLHPDFRIAVSDLTPEAQKVLSAGGYEASIDKMSVCHGLTQYLVMRKKPENKRRRCFTYINASSAHSREDFIRILSRKHRPSSNGIATAMSQRNSEARSRVDMVLPDRSSLFRVASYFREAAV